MTAGGMPPDNSWDIGACAGRIGHVTRFKQGQRTTPRVLEETPIWWMMGTRLIAIRR